MPVHGVAITNCSKPWDQSKPIGRQDVDEHRREKPEGLFDEMFAEDFLKKLIEAF